jgi:beta-glucanase (GH16 family)
MKKNLLTLACCIITGMIYSQCPKLVWSDEFNGTELDLTKWSYQIGDGCDINLCQWGNNELQWYTSNKENVDVSNGTLKIKAIKQTLNNRNYTSGRIRSINKGDFKYGRIEARMKLPIGQGIWPAFWMLPTDNVYGGWPKSGELDIMEYLGHEPSKIHATLHFGNPWPNNSSTTKSYSKPLSKLSDGFHDIVLEWKENEIKWFIDGYLYATKTNFDLNGHPWPFDQKFHLLLNLAVGGNWPGNPNSSTVFPQTYEVDYVRVFDLVGGPHISGNTQVLAGTKNEEYTIQNLPTGSTVNWAVSDGITIKSALGATKLIVDFTSMSGTIKANIKSSCLEYNFELEVLVRQGLSSDIVLENFDDQPKITLTSSSGVLTGKIANPNKTGINTSPLSGRYVRNTATQFDVLFYDISDVKSGADFVTNEKKFYIDIFTTAPVGTQILLQLEDKNSAKPTNYPIGRHSRYTVTTTKSNEWERLGFDFLDRPSTAVSDFSINQLVILFSPNTTNGSTYYFDNFEIYSRKITPLRSGIDTKNFKIYPNPFNNTLNIKSSIKTNRMDLSLFNVQGQYVLRKSVDSYGDITLNTSQLERGLYYLHLRTENGYFSKIVSKW